MNPGSDKRFGGHTAEEIDKLAEEVRVWRMAFTPGSIIREIGSSFDGVVVGSQTNSILNEQFGRSSPSTVRVMRLGEGGGETYTWSRDRCERSAR